jgi:hypothetical protein
MCNNPFVSKNRLSLVGSRIFLLPFAVAVAVTFSGFAYTDASNPDFRSIFSFHSSLPGLVFGRFHDKSAEHALGIR